MKELAKSGTFDLPLSSQTSVCAYNISFVMADIQEWVRRESFANTSDLRMIQEK